VTNSICAPSRATLLTGKYSHKIGLKDNLNKFDGSQITFIKELGKTVINPPELIKEIICNQK
jgi:arylsulfatase A-like enzyme